MSLFNRKNKKKQNKKPGSSDKSEDNSVDESICPLGKDGCSNIQDIINGTEIADMAIELKGDINKYIASAQEQIDSTVKAYEEKNDETLKELKKDVTSVTAQINDRKNKDREYTIARTVQIGLFAIRETRRIQAIIHGENVQKIGVINFNIYGIDKYFGAGYPECIKDIWKIEKLCEKRDKNFDCHADKISSDNDRINHICETIVMGVAEQLKEMKIIDKTKEALTFDEDKILQLMEKYRKQIQKTIIGKKSG